MIGTLSENLRYGAAQLEPNGELLSYRRGHNVCEWRARPQAPDWVAVLDSGIVEEWQGLDWVGRPQALMFPSSGQVTPQLGDRIDRQVNGQIETYQVSAPKGMQPYSVSAYAEHVTIHTKKVAS
jgi:hypothetical protein